MSNLLLQSHSQGLKQFEVCDLLWQDMPRLLPAEYLQARIANFGLIQLGGMMQAWQEIPEARPWDLPHPDPHMQVCISVASHSEIL